VVPLHQLLVSLDRPTLVWLAARHVTLESCTQADLDAWHAEK
jgi:hypothetical protein